MVREQILAEHALLAFCLVIGVPTLFNAALVGPVARHINARFDDMRDLWRAELRRVEEVFNARLRHLEERR